MISCSLQDTQHRKLNIRTVERMKNLHWRCCSRRVYLGRSSTDKWVFVISGQLKLVQVSPERKSSEHGPALILDCHVIRSNALFVFLHARQKISFVSADMRGGHFNLISSQTKTVTCNPLHRHPNQLCIDLFRIQDAIAWSDIFSKTVSDLMLLSLSSGIQLSLSISHSFFLSRPPSKSNQMQT